MRCDGREEYDLIAAHPIPLTYGSVPSVGPRRYTEDPTGPLETVVMYLARELHYRERPGDDWFGLVGSSVTSCCRRAIEARGLDWRWIHGAITKERMSEDTARR